MYYPLLSEQNISEAPILFLEYVPLRSRFGVSSQHKKPGK